MADTSPYAGELADQMDEALRNDNLSEVIDLRVQVYGDPVVTFAQIAQAWSGYLGVEVKATDVPMMMILMKAVRFRQMPDYSDNSDDIEGYLAIVRKLVGDDMIHARSVNEFIEQKWPKVEPIVHFLELVDIDRPEWGWRCGYSKCHWSATGYGQVDAHAAFRRDHKGLGPGVEVR